MASQLSATFNEGLVDEGSTVEMNNEEVRDERQQNDDETVTGMAGNKEYFTSSAWQKNIEEKVKLYQGIKEPHYSNINQAERQSTNQRPSPSIQCHSLSTLPHLVVQGEIQNHVSIWKFPISISQSTIGGRRGSNACTFISLLLAKYYYCNPACNNHELRSNLPLPQEWVYLLTLAIIQGNNTHDRLTGGGAHNFGVREASQAMPLFANRLRISAEFPADLVPQPQPAAELPFYLTQAEQQPKTVALFIINEKTVSFIPHKGGYILIDSHVHQHHGALIAYVKKTDVWELIKFYHASTGRPFTLGTVTMVSF